MLKKQLQFFIDETSTWIRELKLGWEILDIEPYQSFQHYLATLRAKQRWKIKRAKREVSEAGISLKEERLTFLQRLKSLYMIMSHAWCLNQSWFYKILVMLLESTVVLCNSNTYGWYHQNEKRLVALTSYIQRKDNLNIIVFAQWPQQRHWLWWHCIACMIRHALDEHGAKRVYMGLNYRTLKKRTWGTYSQNQIITAQDKDS